MADTTIISFDKQLKGLPVMNAETAWKVGTVTDLAIDPAQGMVSGLLLLSPEEQEVFLPVREGVIFQGFYLLNRSATPHKLPATTNEEANATTEELPEVLRARTDLLGASVVTEQGKLLGNISEVRLDPSDWRVIYRVTDSWWQRWLGQGVDVPASRAVRWSKTTGRLVVTDEQKERHAARSPTKRAMA